MAKIRIDHLNPDSIQTIDDVKTWARDHHIRMDSRHEQTQAALADHQEAIEKASRRLRFATIGFGAVLAIVVLLSGIVQIIKVLF